MQLGCARVIATNLLISNRSLVVNSSNGDVRRWRAVRHLQLVIREAGKPPRRPYIDGVQADICNTTTQVVTLVAREHDAHPHSKRPAGLRVR